MYQLESPYTTSMRYLKAQATFQIQQFCNHVLARSMSDPIIDMENMDRIHEIQGKITDTGILNAIDTMETIDRIQSILDAITDEHSVFNVVCEIMHATEVMKSIAESVDAGELGPTLLRNTRNLFFVYVIGVVDVSYTRDHGRSIIDERFDAEPLVKSIANHMGQMPHLLDWVQRSIGDWTEGMEQDLDMWRNGFRSGMLSQRAF